MERRYIFPLFIILSCLSCNNLSPIDPAGKYRVRLFVDGVSYFPENIADTIIVKIRGVSDTITGIRLPWYHEARGNTGDSVSLFVWDSYLDTWADSGNGFADFAQIRVFWDTTVVSCSAMFRSVPRYGGWIHTDLTVPDDSSVIRVLQYPPEFRPHCDKL